MSGHLNNKITSSHHFAVSCEGPWGRGVMKTQIRKTQTSDLLDPENSDLLKQKKIKKDF